MTTYPFGANVLDYGADPTGTSDNTTAFNSALAASSLIKIPPGTYYFSSSYAISVPSGGCIQFIGGGSDNTVFKFASGIDGFAFTYGSLTSSIKLYGFTVATEDSSGSYVGLSVAATGTTGPPMPTSTLQDICFRGFDGYGDTDYWGNAYKVSGASMFNYIGCTFVGASGEKGVGVDLTGSSPQYSVVHNFSVCNFWSLQTGINYGEYVQGVVANTCNFTAVNFGIYMGPSLSGVDELVVTNSQFYCYNAAVLLETACPHVSISNNRPIFLPPTGSPVGFQATATLDIAIIGNTFDNGSSQNGYGAVFAGYAGRASIVTGNNFVGCATGAYLQSTSEYVNVQSNCYSDCTTNVSNAGSNNTVGGGSE